MAGPTLPGRGFRAAWPAPLRSGSPPRLAGAPGGGFWARRFSRAVCSMRGGAQRAVEERADTAFISARADAQRLRVPGVGYLPELRPPARALSVDPPEAGFRAAAGCDEEGRRMQFGDEAREVGRRRGG